MPLSVSIKTLFRPMIDGRDDSDCRSKHSEPQNSRRILTLETPDIEDIARAIWRRQYDALGSNSGARDWRDKIIPSRFWDEFLLDARAVLSFLYKEHQKYQKNNKPNC